MKPFNATFLLRVAVAIVLLAHSIPSLLDGGVNNFGIYYLDKIGFAPYGVFLAWTIKLSHIVAAYCLLFEKYIKLASLGTIFIFVMGIILVHFEEGWYVVGEGRNGMEFNVLVIFVLLTIMFPKENKKT